jgi:hypothetical protein
MDGLRMTPPDRSRHAAAVARAIAAEARRRDDPDEAERFECIAALAEARAKQHDHGADRQQRGRAVRPRAPRPAE